MKPKIGRQLFDYLEQRKLVEREAIANGTADQHPATATVRVEPDVVIVDNEEPEIQVPEGPSSTSLNDRLAALDAEHNAAMTAAHETYEAERRRLLAERKLAEEAEARKVNVAIAPAIAEALEAVRQGNRASLTSERAGSEHVRDAQIAEQRAKVAPILADAKRAAQEIRKFARLHDATISAVLGMSLSELRSGLPLQGIAAERSVSLTNGVLRNAELARTLIDGTLRTIEEQSRSIESLLAKPQAWGGSQNSHGVRSQESVRELNQLIHDLGNPSDAVPTLNSLISGIGGQLAAIAALRAQYAGSEVLELDVERALTEGEVQDLKDVAAGLLGPEGQRPVQTRAVLDNPRGVFGDGSLVGGA